MLAATKMKMSGSTEKKKKKKTYTQKNTYDVFSTRKRVTRNFLEFSVHIVVVQNNGKEMYKKVCCTCKVAFLLIRPIVVFHRSPALPSPLSITRFYILFEQTINIIESFAFSPG